MLCDVNKISRIPTMHQYVLASFYPPHSSSSSAQSPTVDQSAARHTGLPVAAACENWLIMKPAVMCHSDTWACLAADWSTVGD